ncbi:AraC family transcriptional regulator [Mycolicibacterium goodii]|nr:AraC family transcriptional regulator [Mycolicibacterium goodii]
MTKIERRFRGGLIRHELLDGVAVVEAVGDPHTLQRTPDLIRSDDDAVIVQLNIDGASQIIQHGKFSRFGGGSAVVFDSAEPYTLDVSTTTTSYLIVVPRRALHLSDADLRSVLVTPLTTRTSGIRLLRSMLEATTSMAGHIKLEERSILAGSITDCLRVALTAVRPSANVMARQSLLDALIATVRRELGEQTLSADYLADRHFVSVRTVYYAFESLHTTPARFIQQARLRRASELLLGEGIRLQQVAEACGYQDASTFSRAFRKHFGMAPTMWRKRSVAVQHDQGRISRRTPR